MAGILLGKDLNARGKRVLLPPGAMKDLQADVIKTCLVPVTVDGDVCGEKFVKGQEVLADAHEQRCLRKHASVIDEFMARRRPEGMKSWDPEYSAWLSRNDRAIREGRVKW